MKITLLTGRTFDFGNDFDFDVKIVKSPLAKRLTLRIDDKNRRPVLTVPKYCSRAKALRFLQEHHDWIVNMLARLPQPQHFDDGSVFEFFGITYTVQHIVGQRGAKFENSVLKIGGAPEFLHRRVTDFLKQQALKKLSAMSVKKAKILGCRVSSVSIKDTKSRWGSCSTLGNINYNWRISMAPLDVIEYLVCHEVSHLKHPDHSAEFWQTVAELCPSYEQSRHWLKVRGKTLYRYI